MQLHQAPSSSDSAPRNFFLHSESLEMKASHSFNTSGTTPSDISNDLNDLNLNLRMAPTQFKTLHSKQTYEGLQDCFPSWLYHLCNAVDSERHLVWRNVIYLICLFYMFRSRHIHSWCRKYSELAKMCVQYINMEHSVVNMVQLLKILSPRQDEISCQS